MAEIDNSHEMTDGSTPDHIIVSEAIWRDMMEASQFEVHNSPTDYYGYNKRGFMSMVVWKSQSLDSRGKDAMLLSESVFNKLFPRVKDYE